MSRYARINSTLWTGSKKWRAIQPEAPSEDLDPRTLYFYLHTSQHGTSSLCYYLPPGYAQADLHCTPEAFTKAMASLCEAGLVVFSKGPDVVYPIRAVSEDPPTNPNHALGMLKSLGDIDDCEAKGVCFIELEQCEQYQKLSTSEQLSKAFGKALSSLAKGTGVQGYRGTGVGARVGLGVVVKPAPANDDRQDDGGNGSVAPSEQELIDAMRRYEAVAKAEVEAWNRDFPATTKGLREENYDQMALVQLQREEGKTAADFAKWRQWLKAERKVPRFYQRPRELARPTKQGTGLELWAVIEAEMEDQANNGTPNSGKPGVHSNSPARVYPRDEEAYR